MTQILLKRSTEPLKVPLVTDLASGEIAINTTDGRLFIKKTVVDPVDPLISTDSIVAISNDYNDLVNTPAITIENNSNIRFPTSIEFPVDLGSDGLVLTTNGSGQLSWVQFSSSGGVTTTVRYDINYQNLTNTQKQNARTNIGLSTIAASGNYNDLQGVPTIVIKTFNILGSFSAPFIGTAMFVPVKTALIKTVQATVSEQQTSDLIIGLFKNTALLQMFTIPIGSYTTTFSNLNYSVSPSDYLTVNIISGSGTNLSLALIHA